MFYFSAQLRTGWKKIRSRTGGSTAIVYLHEKIHTQTVGVHCLWGCGNFFKYLSQLYSHYVTGTEDGLLLYNYKHFDFLIKDKHLVKYLYYGRARQECWCSERVALIVVIVIQQLTYNAQPSAKKHFGINPSWQREGTKRAQQRSAYLREVRPLNPLFGDESRCSQIWRCDIILDWCC